MITLHPYLNKIRSKMGAIVPEINNYQIHHFEGGTYSDILYVFLLDHTKKYLLDKHSDPRDPMTLSPSFLSDNNVMACQDIELAMGYWKSSHEIVFYKKGHKVPLDTHLGPPLTSIENLDLKIFPTINLNLIKHSEGCECGVEKTYGIDCNPEFHSDWCRKCLK